MSGGLAETQQCSLSNGPSLFTGSQCSIFVQKQLNIPWLAFVSAGRWLKYAQAQIDFLCSVVANKRTGAMARILEQSANNLSWCCTISSPAVVTCFSLQYFTVVYFSLWCTTSWYFAISVWQRNPAHLPLTVWNRQKVSISPVLTA